MSTHAAPLALRAEGLTVTLGATPVLHGVDLSVSAGEVVGVLGPSGAGKSTLFRVLAGEIEPRSGRVFVHGEDVTPLPLWRRARRGLGYVPQGPSVLLDATLAENLRTFESVAGIRGGSEMGLRALGLSERAEVRASALSGGEQRCLSLLRALVARPTLLVLDEPFAGVDPVRVESITRLLRAASDDGAAIVLADHRVREAVAVCDRVLLLADGRVEVELPPADFVVHPSVRQRYLG